MRQFCDPNTEGMGRFTAWFYVGVESVTWKKNANLQLMFSMSSQKEHTFMEVAWVIGLPQAIIHFILIGIFPLKNHPFYIFEGTSNLGNPHIFTYSSPTKYPKVCWSLDSPSGSKFTLHRGSNVPPFQFQLLYTLWYIISSLPWKIAHQWFILWFTGFTYYFCWLSTQAKNIYNTYNSCHLNNRRYLLRINCPKKNDILNILEIVDEAVYKPLQQIEDVQEVVHQKNHRHCDMHIYIYIYIIIYLHTFILEFIDYGIFPESSLQWKYPWKFHILSFYLQ